MGLSSITVCFVLFVFIFNDTTAKQIWKFCYKNKCICSRYSTATCAENGNSLTYIPPIPTDMTALNFSFNHLHTVNQHTFLNISTLKLKSLILRSNNITFISANAFGNFKHLAKLELSGNPVGLASLKEVLQSLWTLPLTLLSMDTMGHKDQLYEAIIFLNSTTLTEIQLEGNHLTFYNQTSFKHLPKLEKIGLDNNDINSVVFDQASSLKTISLVKNRLFKIPNFCDEKKSPNLSNLFLDQNQIIKISGENIDCLKHLKILSFNTNPIKYIQTNAFMMIHSLRILILRSLNGPLVMIEDFAFNNSKLFRIDLRDNNLKMDTVSPRMFWGCVNLERLSVSYNLFQKVSDTAMNELVYPLKQLTYLEMGNCGLLTIPKAVTMHLTKLEWLSLYKNYITSWPPGTFDNLTSLTELYLMGNLIPSIHEDSFPTWYHHQLKHINVAQNPFDCSCDLLWFVNWFKTNRTIFKELDKRYKCSSPPSVRKVKLIDVKLTEQGCLLSVMTTFVIVTVTSFSLLLTIVISLLYRKRWLLKHYWFMRGHRQRRQQEIEQDYKYDIFVIYCEEDLEWIKQEMLPFLEDNKNLKLCIQQRDFIPGQAIINGIVESVHNSRGFIVVASNKFVKEEWCQFELQLTHKHNDDRDLDRLVIILLEEIDHRHVTPALYAILKTRDYVRWPADEGDRVSFWEHVYREITC